VICLRVQKSGSYQRQPPRRDAPLRSLPRRLQLRLLPKRQASSKLQQHGENPSVRCPYTRWKFPPLPAALPTAPPPARPPAAAPTPPAQAAVNSTASVDTPAKQAASPKAKAKPPAVVVVGQLAGAKSAPAGAKPAASAKAPAPNTPAATAKASVPDARAPAPGAKTPAKAAAKARAAGDGTQGAPFIIPEPKDDEESRLLILRHIVHYQRKELLNHPRPEQLIIHKDFWPAPPIPYVGHPTW